MLLTASGLVVPALPALAKPVDDIHRAVAAGGGLEVSQATAAHFLRSFTVVALRVKLRDLPEYVAVAVRLRPDLSAQIIATTLRLPLGDAKSGPSAPCAVISRIIRAAVIANPEAAVAIYRAAVAAEPDSRECILAAAIAAAPDQRSALLRADESGGMMSAFLNRAGVAGDLTMGGLGTINPGNISGLGGNGNVISPEQPPAQQ